MLIDEWTCCVSATYVAPSIIRAYQLYNITMLFIMMPQYSSNKVVLSVLICLLQIIELIVSVIMTNSGRVRPWPNMNRFDALCPVIDYS